jgi:hypothetical protein
MRLEGYEHLLLASPWLDCVRCWEAVVDGAEREREPLEAPWYLIPPTTPNGHWPTSTQTG